LVLAASSPRIPAQAGTCPDRRLGSKMIFDLLAAAPNELPRCFQPDRVDSNSYSVQQNRTLGSITFFTFEA